MAQKTKTPAKAASHKAASVKQPAKPAAKVVQAAKLQAVKPAPSKPQAKTKVVAKAPAKATSTVTAKPASKVPAQPMKSAAKKIAEKVDVKKPVAAVAPKAAAVVKPALAKAAVAVKPLAPKPVAKAAVAPAAVAPKAAVRPGAPIVVPLAAKPVVAQRAMPASVAKPAAPKLTAPSTSAPAAAVAVPGAPKKPVSSRHGFKTNESIVYPSHGVGRIIGIEEQEIAGITLELFVIQFEKDKMTLRVPTSKLQSVGMRKLAEDGIVKKAMETLKGKARIKRTMWSRRAQEYEAKINSGDLIAIAEVVRDLYRSEAQPEQSYSERQLYEAALDRMAREIAAVDKVDERGAMQRITEVLSKSARSRRAVEEEAQAAAEVKAA